MPSVTTPGLRTAPAGVTSFVPARKIIAVLDGSIFAIRPSPPFVDPGAGVVAPRGGELRPAGGGSCVWASAAATKIAGDSIATNSANVLMCQPPVMRVVLSSDYLQTTTRAPSACSST